MRLYFTLETVDPVVISQTTATTNNHQCLDYIPGSAILGALAAARYSSLDSDQSWRSFHSGDLRFSPCYPVIEDEIALPLPASWHFGKGKEIFDKDSALLARENITNLAAENANRDPSAQYKQVRAGYITSAGKHANVKQGISTKTAIERSSMSAKDGSLFSYSYIAAGQVFAGWIDSNSESLMNEFRDFFDNNTIRIGRSRSAEFGRVQLTISTHDNPIQDQAASKRLTLWCLSDCELENENGIATFTPSVNAIHPTLKGKLNRTESAILTEQVSRFNRARGGLDSAQQLVKRGSVLVFDLDEEASPEALSSIEQYGIGRNKQQGLGWVSVNPDWSSSMHLKDISSPLFNSLKVQSASSSKKSTSVSTLLTEWLSEQVDNETRAQEHAAVVNASLREIVDCYRQARFYRGIVNQHEAGPSRSQWERIDAQLRANHSGWFAAVFEGPNRIAKAENDELGWGAEWFKSSKPTTFESEVRGILSNLPDECMQTLLEKLCRYDLSQHKDLKRIEKELGLEATEATA